MNCHNCVDAFADRHSSSALCVHGNNVRCDGDSLHRVQHTLLARLIRPHISFPVSQFYTVLKITLYYPSILSLHYPSLLPTLPLFTNYTTPLHYLRYPSSLHILQHSLDRCLGLHEVCFRHCRQPYCHTSGGIASEFNGCYRIHNENFRYVHEWLLPSM